MAQLNFADDASYKDIGKQISVNYQRIIRKAEILKEKFTQIYKLHVNLLKQDFLVNSNTHNKYIF